MYKKLLEILSKKSIYNHFVYLYKVTKFEYTNQEY